MVREGNTKQIGPRISQKMADDLEFVVRHQNNGVYKGRLSEEVEMALALYMGKVLNSNPEWFDDLEDDEQKERFQRYGEQFENACANSPLETPLSEEIQELRQELQAINTTNTQMLSQILTQINEEKGADQNLPGT